MSSLPCVAPLPWFKHRRQECANSVLGLCGSSSRLVTQCLGPFAIRWALLWPCHCSPFPAFEASRTVSLATPCSNSCRCERSGRYPTAIASLLRVAAIAPRSAPPTWHRVFCLSWFAPPVASPSRLRTLFCSAMPHLRSQLCHARVRGVRGCQWLWYSSSSPRLQRIARGCVACAPFNMISCEDVDLRSWRLHKGRG